MILSIDCAGAPDSPRAASFRLNPLQVGVPADRLALQLQREHVPQEDGNVVTVLGHRVLKGVARAPEEAEGIWAEAQAIREHQQAASDPSERARPANG